jgi:hypothetical protein
MSKFQIGHTVLKLGNTPVNLLPDVGYIVEDVDFMSGLVKLRGYDELVAVHQLEDITDHVKHTKPKLKEAKQSNKQVGGTHYGEGVDVFDLSLQRKHDCLQHAAIKYIDRHHLKNGAEDIRKAISVLERILKEQYKEEV